MIGTHTTPGGNPFNKTIAYITYGHFSLGAGMRFDQYIKGALETWLEDNVLYLVLNQKWKHQLELTCAKPTNQEPCARLFPIYVQCTEGYYGASPCCKMEQGLLQMWEHHGTYDWYVYQDDDMYLRTDYLETFLAPLPSPQHEPIMLSSKPPRNLGVTWMKDPEKNSNCSTGLDFQYPWGQPAMYSKAALNIIVNGFRNQAMTQICKTFGITHDVGNPIMHWMYILPEVQLPRIPNLDPEYYGKPGGVSHLLGVHGFLSPKYKERKSRTAYEIHAILRNMTFPPPPYQYKWLRPKGFLTTDTYKTYGNASDWVDEWHNMPVSDCQQWKKETVVSPVDTDVLVKDTPTTTPIPSNKSIAYITYGYLKPGSEPRFEMFIKGALETWLQGNDLYYVLNLQFQEKLESICMQEGYQEICSRLYPIYVQCTERYYGASPCCKMEQGLLKMIQEHDNYEWYVYQDDDMYIRTDYLEEFVKPLPSHEAMVLTAKPTRELGHTWDGDHRLRNNCSSHVDFKYPWGQPIIYSKPALQEVSNGFAL
eukprot:CAMPEP_0172455572 /NCGR_PEP_ID=MMETSP1065-20121228/12133_1 /TAXON_ID=265537 /ORGANISM="Amphiprora paludosa, Strain CCMP125" /LENGTH=535 /DNA_ID=CAMNT_0013208037 /DNA_START=24 /DNA_END=1628 /DNA_ORIENTATION=+